MATGHFAPCHELNSTTLQQKIPNGNALLLVYLLASVGSLLDNQLSEHASLSQIGHSDAGGRCTPKIQVEDEPDPNTPLPRIMSTIPPIVFGVV